MTLALLAPSPALARLAASLPAGPAPALVVGLGSGDLVERLLAEGRPVTVVERLPALIRLALHERPALAEAARDGRLELSLGSDVLDQRDSSATRIAHPSFADEYALERALLDSPPRERRAVLLTGGLFVHDVGEALHAQGFDVLPVDPQHWSLDEIALAFDRFQPEVAVSINHRAGLASFCAQRGVPLIVWEIDPCTDRGVTAEENSTTHVFTWRRSQVAAFTRAGFRSVRHLPLGSSQERRRPIAPNDPQLAPLECDVSFVGSSLVGSSRALRERFLDVWAAWHPRGSSREERALAERAVEEVLAAQEREPWGSWILPRLLRERFPELLAAWERSALSDDPLLLLAESSAARARRRILGALAEFTPDVWGDDGWRDAPGILWRGPAGHARELTRIYCASRINIDVGRVYQPDIVTMRVFDVLACGGFVLAERSDDLDELFTVGREIETWEHPGELVAKTRWYLDHPEQRRAFAERGRAAVLERHSIRARVRSMLDRVSVVR